MTILLDGKACAQQIEAELRIRAERLTRKPVLATILVGDDPASATYVRMKGNACKRVGIGSLPVHLPANTTTEQLLRKIHDLNHNPEVRGILLQHPVPHHIDERACFDAIDESKDVDGVTSTGFGRMALGQKVFGSATPQGIMTLLARYQIALRSRHAVVIGRSAILGKPMAAMLLNADATVTICHSKTERLPDLVRQADIVVAALGKPEFVRASWVRDGAVVVDAGYHPPGVGDVELQPLRERVAAYTPVPGGVGPMTIATLIQQTIEAAEKGP